LVTLALFLLVGLTLLLTSSGARAGMNTGHGEPAPKLKARGTEPTYQVTAGLDGDVFPAFASYAALQDAQGRTLGTVTVRVANSSSELLRSRISVHVAGWSDQEVQIAEVAAGHVRDYIFAPSFFVRLYRNRHLTPATAVVTVTDMSGKLTYSGTVPVRIRSVEDMYWGDKFKYAPFIASWVTPHDSRVESILARAKEYLPGRRLPGYEPSKSIDVQSRSTLAQVRAIYRALQQSGVSYVKSSSTFGARANVRMAERIRLPQESLARVSANCIDGAVLYASLFENLGMDAVVVLVPGHSYVGVRLTENSDEYVYLETALTGRAGFDAALQSARRGMAKYSPAQTIRIRIQDARQAGIFPLPNPAGPEEHFLTKVR
jgi:hypothetical protein